MAITGSGTEQDPWIVHDISEIQSCIGQSGKYLKLANDINCNDYGESFVWETLSSDADFDLDGHTIKNIEIGSSARFSSGDSGLIHNGKILNVYLNGSDCFSYNSRFKEVSFSIDASVQEASSSDAAVFYGASTQINKCAIYAKNTKKALIHDGSGYNIEVSETDILIDSDVDTTGSQGSGNWKTYIGAKLSKCRIRGHMKKYNGAALTSSNVDNCVVDLEIETAEITQTVSGGTVTSSVINSEVLNIESQQFTSGYIKCSTSEIKNGDELRAKGFLVVNVEGD
ncbi:MAG TPA: hypothetical protein PLS20_06440 [Ruminococcus flavefaciens]|nr:hypothetical protein [Ruminococcus flavefaciens]